MNAVIKAENLGKKYIIGHQKQRGGATLRDAMTHTARGIWQRIRHPLSPNRESIDLEELWALKDVNFEVQQGERVGIIGANGAGKSTLLKILSRITEPTTGKVRIKGRVSSLLEVGTGFHPELTGRENIFLNGAILGMTRQEVKRKFDEIIAFAELEKFLDTPVKRYSSGMYVRLAFAVAAHLEPEILIVDEVLAVGDAAFQKKCLGKMGDVAKEGRTVLFVSHNMAVINSLCETGIYLQEGRLISYGIMKDVMEKYESDILHSIINESLPPGTIFHKEVADTNNFCICEVKISDINDKAEIRLRTFDTFKVKIKFYSPKFQENGSVSMFFSTIGGMNLLRFATRPDSTLDINFKEGFNEVECEIKQIPLPAATYVVGVGLAIPMRDWLVLNKELCTIEILANDFQNSGFPPTQSFSAAVTKYSWRVID